MKTFQAQKSSEQGSAGVKFLIIFVIIALVGHAGYNYIPVAYEGASFKQEMDTAVVKGLATSGSLKPLEVVQASIQRAAHDYNVPPDAFVEVKASGTVITARVAYTKSVNLLPFGIYKYTYNFDHNASPQGYLLKQ
ncbi:MAG: hypothetical protein JNK51_01460 [Blastocatellia bacterium]|nr:hypothetical protein [Chloracidobacterium sp.]MBL8183564.1 hypothetical protein [Blastocatellia bacterium]HBE81237.1 hypothetical protein [Blastocatellia bacterium]HRJ88504.1 hypothetical protein [Pyrinomonadaceae bacterium]HRK50449.1 hypothetical protein [Pyrinomonadaceae bacterium]